MKKIQNRKNSNVNDWFDSENASLIILCATLGVFGVHKFAQRKTGQGILFILLDLTILGFAVSFVWALLDLIFLTAKPNNKPGNMILGAVFIIANVTASIIVGAADLFLGHDGSKNIPQSEVVFEEELECRVSNGDGPLQRVIIAADTKKADLIVGTDVITVPIKINAHYANVYEGYWDLGIMGLKYSSNPEHKFVVRIIKGDHSANIIGRLNGYFADYICKKTNP